jgi:hypothetical protein
MIGNALKIINWLYSQGKDKLFEIREYKEQRNKKQNAKYWKLLGQLSMELGISIEETHFEMLKSYSQRYEICVPSNEEIRGIEYFEKKSKFTKNEMEYSTYYVYVPSHELNTKEFAFLLNGLCEECRQQGIETLSPNELAELKQLMEG